MIRETYKQLVQDDVRLTAFIKEIFEKGHATLEHFFDDETERALHAFMADRAFTGKKNNELKGTIAGDLRDSDEIFAFCEAVVKKRHELEGKTHVPLLRDKQTVGFPYKDARNGAKTVETEYHYDGAFFNGVLPILLPDNPEKNGGNLEIFPNMRRKYPAIICKPLSQILRRSSLARSMYGYVTVPYKIDAMHCFFGDVTLHGVPPIASGERIVMTVNSHW